MSFKLRWLLALAVTLWLLIFLPSHPSQGQRKKPAKEPAQTETVKPLNKTDVLGFLSDMASSKTSKGRRDAASFLIQHVQREKVDFELTNEDETDLQKAGREAISEDAELSGFIPTLIEAIRKNYRPDTNAALIAHNEGINYYRSGDDKKAAGDDKKAADDYKKAAEAYKRALQHYKRDETYYHLGQVLHYGLQQYKEAEEAFNNAILLKPDYVEARYSLALLYNDLNQFEKAIDSLKKVFETNSTYADAHCLLGSIYVSLTRYEDAVEPFKKAIEYKTSQLANAHYGLGISYFKKKEALERKKEELEKKKKELEQYDNLLKDLDKEALEMKKKALEQCDLLKDHDKELANKLYGIIK